MPRARKSSKVRQKSASKSSAGSVSSLGKPMITGLVIGVAAFALTAILGWFVALGAIKNYLKSEAFSTMIAEKASESLKAKSQLEGVKWDGNASSVFANSFHASGYEDASFSRLEVSGLNANFELSLSYIIGCIREGAWKISSVEINQLNLHFSDERHSGTYEQAHPKPLRPVSGIAASATADPPSASGWADLLPKETKIDQIHLKNVNLIWRKDDRAYQAVGVEVMATPTSAEGSYRIQAWNGVIQGSGLPNFDINAMDFQWKPEISEFFIATATCDVLGGRLEVDGEIVFGENSKVDVRANMSKVNLAKMVPEDWAKRISGEIAIDATITGTLEQTQSQGTVTIDKGVLEALPVLDQLATYTKTERFRRIAMNRAAAKFANNGQQLLIHDIYLQSDGLARLEGNLAIHEGALDGALQLGVIPGTLKWIPAVDVEKHLFKEERDGHRWTPVTVDGTLADPRHDLDEQLAAAGISAGIETIGDTLKSIQENPGSAEDKAKELLDAGKKLFELFK